MPVKCVQNVCIVVELIQEGLCQICRHFFVLGTNESMSIDGMDYSAVLFCKNLSNVSFRQYNYST